MLFSDETLLMMSDHSLENLQKKVKEQMISINQWFRQNKLSLNYCKTNFTVITNQLETLASKIHYCLKQYYFKKRVSTVKYLGLFMQPS